MSLCSPPDSTLPPFRYIKPCPHPLTTLLIQVTFGELEVPMPTSLLLAPWHSKVLLYHFEPPSTPVVIIPSLSTPLQVSISVLLNPTTFLVLPAFASMKMSAVTCAPMQPPNVSNCQVTSSGPAL